MRHSLTFLLLLMSFSVWAQREQFDLLTYQPPKKWKKETFTERIEYTLVNKDTKSWCIISLYKSIASKGSIALDFGDDWRNIVRKMYTAADVRHTEASAAEGWSIQSGASKVLFNRQDAFVILTTFTGYNKTLSILGTTNDSAYLRHISDFMGHIALGKPGEEADPIANTGYKFNTTNWDDGWTSTVQTDWVELRKTNNRVLVHYPNQQADAYNSVLKAGTANAWNVLVAPRYSEIRNYRDRSIQSCNSISYVEADGLDRQTGQWVYIVLFKKYFDNGNGRWLEFINADKAGFENTFGAYHNTEFNWDKMVNMQYKNRFALDAEDIIGKWGANDYASLRYYYAGSGSFAGATATSTANEFTFLSGNNYTSDHAGASGVVGAQHFSRTVYQGKSTINEWTLTLTNRFQGATETYSAYYEAIKGGRILMLTDRNNSTYSLVRNSR